MPPLSLTARAGLICNGRASGDEDSDNVKSSGLILPPFAGVSARPRYGTWGHWGERCLRTRYCRELACSRGIVAKAKIVTAAGDNHPCEDLHKRTEGRRFHYGNIVPAQPAGTKWGYRKFAVRERFDYATVAAAVVMTFDGPALRGHKDRPRRRGLHRDRRPGLPKMRSGAGS